MSDVLGQFDHWLKDDSDVAALVMRQYLEPVEGKDRAVIFPPTYTLAKTDVASRFSKGEAVPGVYKGQKGPMGYNLDILPDGTSVCQLDSVGAQANRMEPIFMRENYKDLVPQVVVKVSDKTVNLLEVGHRAADAIVRFSDLRMELEEAFNDVRAGDATKLAKIAPTSLVFGVWDSRGTQVKLPRIVRSVIRAFDVMPIHRSSQYIPAVDYVGMGLVSPPAGEQEQDAMSEEGISPAPAAWSHGGVVVKGEILRDATLNLAALRGLRAGDKDPLPLRRYILGLALVALTAPQENFLREGCQLVPEKARPAEWSLVKHDGSRDKNIPLTHEEALTYARETAKAFGVGPEKKASFNPDTLRAALTQPKEKRKESRRTKAAGSETGANR